MKHTTASGAHLRYYLHATTVQMEVGLSPALSLSQLTPSSNRFDSVTYSSDTSSLTLSGWLVPTLWSLVLKLIRCHIGRLRLNSTTYSCLLVKHEPHQNSVGD